MDGERDIVRARQLETVNIMETIGRVTDEVEKSWTREAENVQVKENVNSLAWKFISSSQMDDLVQLTVDGVQKTLAEILEFKHYQNCMKEGILLDYYVSGFCWTKEQKFTMLQTSTFMTLLKIILENISEKHLSLPDNLKELKKVMAEVVLSRLEKGGSREFFTVDQGKAIISYMKISLFQHYKLYEFLFNETPDVEILDTEIEVEVIKPVDPFPSPLEESFTWDIYSSYVLLQPSEEMVTEVEMKAGESGEVTETTTVDRLVNYTIDDVKSALGEVTGEVLRNLQTEINEKLQKQEEAYTARINKLIKQ
ncbi:ciliary-associated calcium-binding coiled-coil protein 1 [Scyliorhinus canicula]|uniref:ciliary-associated calcium-binding coiled-coil protein 1 n=1 Tax=Scyliorhinus canicula TaxID=7830 RepID=UPI0018F73394|nr:ciliary-associated calcium-binding coiled-coil protein 1 [Scyliorhinus canicula]